MNWSGIGQTFLLELRSGWKGFLLFGILVLLIAGGLPPMFPDYRDSFFEKLEGANRVNLIIPDDDGENLTMNISWEAVEGAISYTVLQDNRTSMLTSKIVYIGPAANTSIALPYDADNDETHYYGVVAQLNTSNETILIGIASTKQLDNPYDELINDPSMAGFTGGRNIPLTEIQGFVSLQVFSWWWIPMGLFIAYLSVAVITSDFEGKRMDLLFSTPLSRRRYLLEKFMALALFILLLLLMAAGGLIGSLEGIGMSDELGAERVVLAFLGCWPFLMFIGAIGILAGVLFRNTKIGIGLSFAFVFISFMFATISGFAPSVQGMKYLSVMTYWDYNSVILDGVFNLVHFFGLWAAVAVVLTLAVIVFKKQDIPA